MAQSTRRLRWSPSLIRASLAGHSLMGLVFGALIYQVCLTGTLSVFAAQLQRWEQPNAPVVRDASPEAFARAATDAVAGEDRRGKTIFLIGPTRDKPRFETRIAGSGAAGTLLDSDGHIQTTVETPWTSFVVELHDELSMPAPWGRIVIGLSGVVLLALIFTGICTHSRIFRDAFHLRLGDRSRLSESDLHNRMSVWSLPFQIVVTATGAILAIGGLLGPVLILIAYGTDAETGLRDFLGPQPAAEKMNAAPLPDIAALIRQIETAHPPANVSFVEISQAGTAGQVISVDTNAPADLASGESHRFSGDGTYLGTAGYTSGPAGKQMLAALPPLHYGNFGGITIAIAYGVLGAMLCAVCATGTNIWLIRRRQRGQSSPFWDHVWIVLVWGQPAILALSAVASTGGADPLHFYALATVASFALVAFDIAPDALRQRLRLFTACATALAVAANVTLQGILPGDGMAPIVNAVLIASAVLLVLMTLRHSRSR